MRGGAAKACVTASGLYGSVSGSPTADVATTGPLTIPIMKKMGIPAARAGAIEATASSGGAMLPPLRVQPELAPGVLVVDIGIAQDLLKMPGQLSRLLIGKTTGKRASLESIAGDRLRLIEPSAETDLERLTDSFHLNLTAFGLLSFFVGLFIN